MGVLPRTVSELAAILHRPIDAILAAAHSLHIDVSAADSILTFTHVQLLYNHFQSVPEVARTNTIVAGTSAKGTAIQDMSVRDQSNQSGPKSAHYRLTQLLASANSQIELLKAQCAQLVVVKRRLLDTQKVKLDKADRARIQAEERYGQGAQELKSERLMRNGETAALRSQVANLQAELKTLQGQPQLHEASPYVESLKSEIASLRDDLRRAIRIHKDVLSGKRQTLTRAESQIRILTRQNRLLEDRLSEMRARAITTRPALPKSTRATTTKDRTTSPRPLEETDKVRRWLRKVGQGHARVFAGKSVAVLGYGPIAASTIRKRLMANGATLTRCGDSGAGLLITGRNGWTADDIEEHIKARSGASLHIYSQEMAILAISCGYDLFKAADRATLLTMADGHPALQFCIEEGFLWPVLNTRRIAKRLEAIWDEKVEESPLKKLGYTVGVTHGLHSTARRELLTNALSKSLPRVESVNYMDTWGANNSRRRLRRMAHFIAWLIRSRQTVPGMTQAVSDWRADLDWVHAELYEDWMSFRWPQVKVSANRSTKARR